MTKRIKEMEKLLIEIINQKRISEARVSSLV